MAYNDFGKYDFLNVIGIHKYFFSIKNCLLNNKVTRLKFITMLILPLNYKVITKEELLSIFSTKGQISVGKKLYIFYCRYY